MTEPNRLSRDPLAITGMVVVGVAAAVLSFSTWVQLAEAVGFTQTWAAGSPISGHRFTIRIAWLMPLAVDWYTVTVVRVWLRSPAGSPVIGYAKANAVGAIVLTVAAQAAFHAFTSAGWRLADLWWFSILVGGIPPLLLGLVMDLYTRLNHEHHAEPTERAATSTHSHQPRPSRPAPAEPPAPRPEPSRPRTVRRPAEPAGVHSVGEPADDDLLRHVHLVVESWVAERGEPPGQHTVRNALAALNPPIRIGLRRAGRLVDRAMREPRTEPGDTQQRAPGAEPIGASA